MNILLTNDDGYEASGITELFNSLSSQHKVFIVAPKENCSGMSAAISLRKEIEVKEINQNIFQFLGTPADCSYLGLLSVIPEPVEMIVSGINLGANLGEDVFYSGTVGAAIAGRRLDYVPVAFSVAAYNPTNLRFISEQSLLITNQVSKLPSDQNLLVNVNFPDLPSSEIKGTCITSLGKGASQILQISSGLKILLNFIVWAIRAHFCLIKQEQIFKQLSKIIFLFQFLITT